MTESSFPEEESATTSASGATSNSDNTFEVEDENASEIEEGEVTPGTQGMIRGRLHRRSAFERVSMRILATGGIIGLDVALGAILVANHVKGWIDGLVIGLVSVVLAAVLWSSRQL